MDFGAAAVFFQAVVGFGPGGELGAVLRPMDYGGFVAPLDEFAHGGAVRAGNHEPFQRGFVGPEGGGPEGVAAIAEQLHCKVPSGVGRLARGAGGIPGEHREETPGAQTQARDGYQWHEVMITLEQDGEMNVHCKSQGERARPPHCQDFLHSRAQVCTEIVAEFC